MDRLACHAHHHLFQVRGDFRKVHARVQGVLSRWIGIEHAVESAPNFPTSHTDLLVLSDRIKSIITPTEPLTPGILYVGIATLTGSIITRSRGLTVRLFFDAVLLPTNQREHRCVPSVAEQHGAFNEWVWCGAVRVRVNREESCVKKRERDFDDAVFRRLPHRHA